uniref:Uncharacterized protein LOC116940322 isoform X2 n=1 Tax=Petromyzon marinus TaxID=7757 RepID=A0AAJ7SUT5_PETMA|nr:uncharacterized protein LOC116940322 isoform X2 [Petromyzon marinus]
MTSLAPDPFPLKFGVNFRMESGISESSDPNNGDAGKCVERSAATRRRRLRRERLHGAERHRGFWRRGRGANRGPSLAGGHHRALRPRHGVGALRQRRGRLGAGAGPPGAHRHLGLPHQPGAGRPHDGPLLPALHLHRDPFRVREHLHAHDHRHRPLLRGVSPAALAHDQVQGKGAHCPHLGRVDQHLVGATGHLSAGQGEMPGGGLAQPRIPAELHGGAAARHLSAAPPGAHPRLLQRGRAAVGPADTWQRRPQPRAPPGALQAEGDQDAEHYRAHVRRVLAAAQRVPSAARVRALAAASPPRLRHGPLLLLSLPRHVAQRVEPPGLRLLQRQLQGRPAPAVLAPLLRRAVPRLPMRSSVRSERRGRRRQEQGEEAEELQHEHALQLAGEEDPAPGQLRAHLPHGGHGPPASGWEPPQSARSAACKKRNWFVFGNLHMK